MSTKPNKTLEDLLSWIPALILAAVMVVATCTLTLFAHLLKKPLLRLIDIEGWSNTWNKLKWLYLPLLWTSGTVATVLLFQITLVLALAPNWKDHVTDLSISTTVASLCIVTYSVFHWLREFASDPDNQKRQAGLKAELNVARILNANRHRYLHAECLHNSLFVFNEGKENEYSVEADHILVTQHHVYVIETKYKSGRVQADANADNWTTFTENGQGSMRNALAQVKNSAKVLERECAIDHPCIPLVAIYGKDTEIVDGPSNVTIADDIVKIIDAFEAEAKFSRIKPTQIVGKLKLHERKDKTALERHKARANQASVRKEMESIVRNASR